MKLAIGSDHGGYELKQTVMEHLESKGIEFKDYGTFSKDSTDYPIYGELVAEAVSSNDYDLGIVICGTGIGISLAANKVKGIRAATVSDVFSAKMSRAHNNANVIGFGERVVGKGLALEIVDAFLETKFEGGRHSRRVDLISEIEKKNQK
ncbi:ribose 5-phosphate isomerase B [Helicovermis profundi]|uniref:Ribose 5-phosphate isomerase B n=1 Tax=Helicovermis profundi TaxID=3065157 RepID=A0AAU9EUX2_9FIRM|nr:ribose 5-phosphate isomerase B [Clostridia bacterium S502]